MDPAKAFPTSDEPAHLNYWRRETFAYETGLAGTAYADAGITAPALLETSIRPGGDVELWLADVSGTGGFDWPVPRLARFARELGATQARWAGRVPPIGWLSRRWLAQYLARASGWLGPVEPAVWDRPSLAPWPEPVRSRLRELWAGRDRVLAVAEAAPHTLCHLAHRRLGRVELASPPASPPGLDLASSRRPTRRPASASYRGDIRERHQRSPKWTPAS